MYFQLGKYQYKCHSHHHLYHHALIFVPLSLIRPAGKTYVSVCFTDCTQLFIAHLFLQKVSKKNIIIIS